MFQLKGARILENQGFWTLLVFPDKAVVKIRTARMRRYGEGVHVTQEVMGHWMVQREIPACWGAVWPQHCKRELFPRMIQRSDQSLTSEETAGIEATGKALGLSKKHLILLKIAALEGRHLLRKARRWWDFRRARARRRLRNILPEVIGQFLDDVIARHFVTGEHPNRLTDAFGGMERALYPQLAPS